MATYLSGKEIGERLRRVRGIIDGLIRQRDEIERFAEAQMDEGQTAATVETSVNGLLTDWEALKAQAVTELTAIPYVWKPQVRIGMPALYKAAYVLANEQGNVNSVTGAAGGSISINSDAETTTSPFSVFAAGDVVSISKAEDSANRITGIVQYTPASPSTTRITNGDFSDSTPATAWTETGDGGTEVVITAGVATFTSADCTLAQAKADMIGGGWTNAARYLVRFTLDTVTTGTLSVGTTTDPAQHVVTANGNHRAIILADNDAAGLIFTASGTFTGNLTNISVIPWTGIALDCPLLNDNAYDTKIVVALEERS